MILTVIFWVLLLLALIGAFAPEPWRPWGVRILFILITLLGLRVFPIDR